MTIQALRDLVAAVQFRRGWTLALEVVPRNPAYLAGGMREVLFTVTALVEDAYAAPGELPRVVKVRQTEGWALEAVEAMDEGQTIAWIWDFIRSADEHEAREWFRVRGIAVLDPHRASTRG